MSDDVAAVQARLIELGFDPGPVDGYHGDATLRAIWAYQTLVAGVDRTEIYLPEQVITVFHRDRPVLISHMSGKPGAIGFQPAEPSATSCSRVFAPKTPAQP